MSCVFIASWLGIFRISTESIVDAEQVIKYTRWPGSDFLPMVVSNPEEEEKRRMIKPAHT